MIHSQYNEKQYVNCKLTHFFRMETVHKLVLLLARCPARVV